MYIRTYYVPRVTFLSSSATRHFLSRLSLSLALITIPISPSTRSLTHRGLLHIPSFLFLFLFPREMKTYSFFIPLPPLHHDNLSFSTASVATVAAAPAAASATAITLFPLPLPSSPRTARVYVCVHERMCACYLTVYIYIISSSLFHFIPVSYSV